MRSPFATFAHTSGESTKGDGRRAYRTAGYLERSSGSRIAAAFPGVATRANPQCPCVDKGGALAAQTILARTRTALSRGKIVSIAPACRSASVSPAFGSPRHAYTRRHYAVPDPPNDRLQRTPESVIFLAGATKPLLPAAAEPRS
jgi:hypothetical protein